MSKLTWEKIRKLEVIKLYAGDIPKWHRSKNFIGLSLFYNTSSHIRQDITKPIPLEDNTVDIFVSEDVFEHIEYEKLPAVIDEIYRILKPGSLFRLAVPDYGCDVLQNRCTKNEKGQIIFDPAAGGEHVWFPRIDTVTQLIERTKFHDGGKVEFFHYYEMDGTSVMKPIDHSLVRIKRTPDFDKRVKKPRRPMSLVVDLRKI